LKTLVLRDLHWLPMWQLTLFKLAMIVFKCLHGLAQSYLADDCVLASAAASRRHMQSADNVKMLVRRTWTVIGARDFALGLSSCSVRTYVRKLKTFYARATM